MHTPAWMSKFLRFWMIIDMAAGHEFWRGAACGFGLGEGRVWRSVYWPEGFFVNFLTWTNKEPYS
jgi:hypothetical protein